MQRNMIRSLLDVSVTKTQLRADEYISRQHQQHLAPPRLSPLTQRGEAVVLLSPHHDPDLITQHLTTSIQQQLQLQLL